MFYREMLKALGLHSKFIRPIIGSNLVQRISLPIIVNNNNLIKRDFHATTSKLGGGDHEFIVNKNNNKTVYTRLI